MTKKEWLACADPKPMLEWLAEKLSERKLRLIAVACCRHLWHLLTEAASREAVEVSERYADGLERKSALAASRARARRVVEPQRKTSTVHGKAAYNAWSSARDNIAAVVPKLAGGVAWTSSYRRPNASFTADSANVSRNHKAVASLVRDVAGDPFRAAKIRSAWRTADVTELAAVIYEDRAFKRMPILADALEEAGCTDEAILSHCRGPGPHVRGCWVVDLVLGRATA